MKFIKPFLPVCSIFMLMAMIACNGENPADNQISDIDLESGEFAIIEVADAMDAIEDATMETAMGFSPGLFDGGFFRNGGRFGRGGPRGPFGLRALRLKTGNHLKEVLRELNLSEEQKLQLRELMSGQRECIQEPLQAFRDANQEIIDAANVERQTIIDSYRNGEITREEAKDLLEALNETTREAILANPESEAPIQAMCDCKLSLFDNVHAILDETQQAAWDEWVAGLDSGCFANGE
ncbi:hypothetical protein MJD09_16675 [bacterium]|nr:hypothetical protein [bacterium]